MSDQAAEVQPGADQIVELPHNDDAAFAALMDTLAPEPDGEPAGQGDPAAAGAGTADGAPAGEGAAAGTGAGADAAPAGGGQPGAGAQPGQQGQPPAGAADPNLPTAGVDTAADTGAQSTGAADPAGGAGVDRPASWTASAADYAPALGELSTKYEDTVAAKYQADAVTEVRDAYPKYFEALEQHPRLLVGQEVPAIGREGVERLRSTEDAKDWQDAVKSILAAEVRDRATRSMESNADELNVVHASIEMFQKNADLIPGTKEFDVELANAITTMAKPYEVRVDGKLRGYNIDVQPHIELLRSRLAAERAKAPAAPAAPSPAAGTQAAPAAPQAASEPPQAGIQSKAGQGDQAEDFSTLFGTIGLPDLRI